MKLIIGLIIVAYIIYKYVNISEKSKVKVKPRESTSLSKQEKVLNENLLGWMEKRWEIANKERTEGNFEKVPNWFFDEATERQYTKLEEEGFNLKKGSLTKGQASDIIGLFEDAEEDSIEILRFFKIPLKGMSQSKARHTIGELFNDQGNLRKWETRPATPMQKEFYKFFGIKVSQGLTHNDAENNIKEIKSELFSKDREKLDEWEDYESLYDEINEPDFREDYDLKKISLSLYRSTIEQLKNEGKSLANLLDDTDLVVDKIIEIKPEIEKA